MVELLDAVVRCNVALGQFASSPLYEGVFFLCNRHAQSFLDWCLEKVSLPTTCDFLLVALQRKECTELRAEFSKLGPSLCRVVYEPCKEALCSAKDLKVQILQANQLLGITEALYAGGNREGQRELVPRPPSTPPPEKLLQSHPTAVVAASSTVAHGGASLLGPPRAAAFRPTRGPD